MKINKKFSVLDSLSISLAILTSFLITRAKMNITNIINNNTLLLIFKWEIKNEIY